MVCTGRSSDGRYCHSKPLGESSSASINSSQRQSDAWRDVRLFGDCMDGSHCARQVFKLWLFPFYTLCLGLRVCDFIRRTY